MSFAWLDDDDGDDALPPSQSTNGVYESETVFHCNKCGSSETYIDSASGLRVCSDCFTAHLQSQQETIEYEEIAAVAAKVRGGAFRQATRLDSRSINNRARKPLETYDTSQPLPELGSCLQGMKVVLSASTEMICNEILPNLPHQQPSIYVLTEEDPKRLKNMVRDLWMAYLRSWADGAQHYGKLYPHSRFCMLDSFLSIKHRTLLGRFLEVKHLTNNSRSSATDGATPVSGIDNPSRKQKEPKKKVNFFDTIASEKGHSDDDGDNEMNDESNNEGEDADASSVSDQGDEGVEFYAKAQRRSFKTTRLTQFGTLKALVNRHCAEHNQSYDSKTAALLIQPSMHLVAAILLLALLANNVVIPTFQFLRWIETGQLPLKSAFEDLFPAGQLKNRLNLVSWFFRSYRQPIPAKFDRLVTALAVACRIRSSAYEFCYRKKGCFSFFTHQFIWNGPHTLALRMAQFSAAAGLPRSVLDRALMLAGLPPTAAANDTDSSSSSNDDSSISSSSSNRSASYENNGATNQWNRDAWPTTNPTTHKKDFDITGPNTIKGIPQVVNPQDVATPEDVLALLAIACQFDPDWREWKYYRASKQHFVMPHNETELLNMDNPSRYLNHCYEKVFVELQDRRPKEILRLPKNLLSEQELMAGEDLNTSVGKTDSLSVKSIASTIDQSSYSQSPSIQGSTKRLVGTPTQVSSSNGDGFDSDDLFDGPVKKEETELKNSGFESDDLFGGSVNKNPTKEFKDGRTSGSESVDETSLFTDLSKAGPTKESKAAESNGFESDDDIFGESANHIGSTKGDKYGKSTRLAKSTKGSESDDSSEHDLTKELLGGDKSKTRDEDDATTADKSSAVRSKRRVPASKTSKQKRRSHGIWAVVDDESSEGDDISDTTNEKSGSEKSSHDDDDDEENEEAWGLHPLKPATRLKPNDVICGIPIPSSDSSEPKRGTKRFRVHNINAASASQPKPTRRPCDFSNCNLAVQWSDASLPRLDPKILQLLQHLAYSADLTNIDHVEDLMVYYLQGRGIARYTDRQTGREMTIRSWTKKLSTDVKL